MTPPGGPFPSFEQQDWVEKILPILSPRHKPVQCEQKGGQILYVPEGWYHAVTNVQPSVAVAHQIKPMMRWLSQFRGIPDASVCEDLGCTEAFLLAGRWKAAIGRLSGSMRMFDTALRINPLDAITWRQKGLALEQ